MTAFLYLVFAAISTKLAALTGHASLPTDGSAGWLPTCPTLERLAEILEQYEDFVTYPRLMDRTSSSTARYQGDIRRRRRQLEFTGPILRSTACRAICADTPYLAHFDLDFEVPVGISDNHDRYAAMCEMDESSTRSGSWLPFRQADQRG